MANDIVKIIEDAASEYGIDPVFMRRMAEIESRMNPRALNNGSKAAGLFQFIPSTAKSYGLDNVSVYDPVKNTRAAARLTANNKKFLEKNGIPATPAWLYLAHQQGAGGARSIWNEYGKNTRISDLPNSLQRNIRSNIPQSKRESIATVQDFVNFYGSKFGDGKVAVPAEQSAQPATIARASVVPVASATMSVANPQPVFSAPIQRERPQLLQSRLEWQPIEFASLLNRGR